MEYAKNTSKREFVQFSNFDYKVFDLVILAIKSVCRLLQGDYSSQNVFAAIPEKYDPYQGTKKKVTLSITFNIFLLQ